MSYPKKDFQDITNESGQPVIVIEKEEGLTPKEKKILQDTMRRHDKAFKMLASM